MATADWIQEAATAVLRTEDAFPTYHFYNNSVEVSYDDAEHSYFRFGQDGETIEIPSVTTILHKAVDKSYALIPWATKLMAEHLRTNLLNQDGTFRQLSTEEFNNLVETARAQHKVKLEEAGDIGSAVHNALEMAAKKAIAETDGYIRSMAFMPALPVGYEQGSDVALELRTSLARNCFVAALEWCRRHNTQFVFTERKIYSRAYDYAGTTDGVVYVDSCDDLTCCRGRSFKRQLAVLDFKSSSGLRDEYAWQVAAYQFALIEELEMPITHRYVLRLGKEDGKFEPWYLEPSFFEDDLKTFLDALSLFKSLEAIRTRRSEDKKALNALIKAEKDKAKALEAEAKKVAKEEARLAKKAESDAKRAIREEEKAERRAAKTKPGPVLVENPFTAQPGKLVPVTVDRAFVAKDESAELAPSKGFDEDFWAGGFGIDAGGKQVGIAPVKSNIVNLNEDTVNNIEPKPAVVPEIQAVAEPVIAPQTEESRQYEQNRATIRFWSLGTTFTTGGWLQ